MYSGDFYFLSGENKNATYSPKGVGTTPFTDLQHKTYLKNHCE